MDSRLANTWRLTVNDRKFIETVLLSGIIIDGRNPYEYRKLSVKFGREDGSSEVQLGQTHAIGFVTCQLLQPYRDRPNGGTLSIFTEFSPMADPSFEPCGGVGKIIDRGLRNLVDAANIAALAALLTFRRPPECSLGGEDGHEVILHPPEVIDPTHHEEAVMAGRMTATRNANGDICAIQKPGGEGVLQTVIMQCLRLASRTAGDITKKINDAVEAYKTKLALSKIKRYPASIALESIGSGGNVKGKQNLSFEHKGVSELSWRGQNWHWREVVLVRKMVKVKPNYLSWVEISGMVAVLILLEAPQVGILTRWVLIQIS